MKAALEVMDKLKNIGIFLDLPDIIELLNVSMDLKLLEAGKRFEVCYEVPVKIQFCCI